MLQYVYVFIVRIYLHLDFLISIFQKSSNINIGDWDLNNQIKSTP